MALKVLLVAGLVLAQGVAQAQTVTEQDQCRAYAVEIKRDRDAKEARIVELLVQIAALRAEVKKLTTPPPVEKK